MKYIASFVLLCLLAGCQKPPTQTPPSTPENANTNPNESSQSTPFETDNNSIKNIEDQEFKAELSALLKQMEPGILEKAQASELTKEHAQGLIDNPDQSDFQLQALYQPLANSNLETRLLQKNIFTTDNLVSGYLSDGDQKQARLRFIKQVESILGSTPFTHYGLSVLRQGQAWYVSFILLTELLELDGVSLELSKPKTQTYTGLLTQTNYREPEMLVTRPDGQVEKVMVQLIGADQFQAQLNFEDQGLYSVEVNVRGPLGSLPATNFIVSVQADYPRASGQATQLESIVNLSSAQQKMLDLVNQDRSNMGLPLLQLDAALSQAAQAHCDDMVTNGFIGHNSPTVGTPQQQAALSQVSDLVAQNISVSKSLDNAQLELMSSPGHRQTILNDAHTHAGFGVTTGFDGFLYLTQLFIHRELEIEPIAFEHSLNQSLDIKGRSSKAGAVAVYIDRDIQGDYQEVAAGESFSLPVNFTKPGQQRLRIGYAPPAGAEGNLNFTFYNIWDLEIVP